MHDPLIGPWESLKDHRGVFPLKENGQDENSIGISQSFGDFLSSRLKFGSLSSIG